METVKWDLTKKKMDSVIKITKRSLLVRDLQIEKQVLLKLNEWFLKEERKLLLKEGKLRGFKRKDEIFIDKK